MRRRESERVGGYDRFYLLDRRLYDVAKSFQLGKSVLRQHSEEDTLKYLASAIDADMYIIPCNVLGGGFR